MEFVTIDIIRAKLKEFPTCATPHILVLNPTQLKALTEELLNSSTEEEYQLFRKSLVLRIDRWDLQVYVDKFKKQITVYGR